MNMAKKSRRATAKFQKELTVIQYILLIMWTAHNCTHLPMSAVIASKITSKTSNNIPALFLFGDSILDTGNNDRLRTIARADFSPYGENFVNNVATGRFSDGLILGDYIATYLGLPFVPPYLDRGENIMQGVCFASSASGILDATGDKFGEHIALSQQVEYFRQVKGMVSAKLGDEQATAFLSRSLHLIVTGSNDFFTNYDQDNGLPPTFQADLLSKFLFHLQEIYDVGARKIVIVSVPPLGCVPSVRYRTRPAGECDAALNAAISSFNAAVLSAISTTTANFLGAHILYANAFDLALDLLNNPSAFGLKDGTTACCGWGQFGAAAPCLPLLDQLCDDPSEHVFWDRVHPSSATYRIIARQFWDGHPPRYITPINIHQLSLLP